MDMLVKLYTLPPLEPLLARQREAGVTIRRAMAAEKRQVVAWVAQTFDDYWASECDVAFSRQPITCFIALEQQQMVGFACHEVTCRSFFGPTGVSPTQQGRGIGQVLLLASLHDLATQGYAYAIIGGVGPAEFYTKVVGAIPIPDSTPGIYQKLVS